MNKFEKVSSLGHQMSLSGGGVGAWGRAKGGGPCTGELLGSGGFLYSEVKVEVEQV